MGIGILNLRRAAGPSCEDFFWPAAIVQVDGIEVGETELPLGSRRPQHFVSSDLPNASLLRVGSTSGVASRLRVSTVGWRFFTEDGLPGASVVRPQQREHGMRG